MLTSDTDVPGVVSHVKILETNVRTLSVNRVELVSGDSLAACPCVAGETLLSLADVDHGVAFRADSDLVFGGFSVVEEDAAMLEKDLEQLLRGGVGHGRVFSRDPGAAAEMVGQSPFGDVSFAAATGGG